MYSFQADEPQESTVMHAGVEAIVVEQSADINDLIINRRTQGANCSATDGVRGTEEAGTGIVAAYIKVDDFSCCNLHCSCSSLAIWIIEKGKGSSKVICKSVTFS